MNIMSFLFRLSGKEQLMEEAFDNLIIPNPGSAMLDVGCGDGSRTAQMAARGKATRIFGVDINADLAHSAYSNGVKLSIQDIDSSGLAFSDDSFSVIVTNHSTFAQI